MTEKSFYRWRRKYSGIGLAELRRLKELERENRKLKQLVADLTLDKHLFAGGDPKKALKPVQKRFLAEFLTRGLG